MRQKHECIKKTNELISKLKDTIRKQNNEGIKKTNELISKLKTIFVNRKISTYRKQTS